MTALFDPDEPFTCEKHRGLEKHDAAWMLLVACPDCSTRATSIIERTADNFSAIMRALTEKKP